jgi:hypothetical protein
MKLGMRVTFVLAIIVLLAVHWLIFRETEGFYSDSSDYTRLSSKVKTKLANYCKLADLIREQVVSGYAGTNPESASLATEEVNNGYKEMYMCTDDKASSRPSCSKPNTTDMVYVSSDIYMKMPTWTDDISAVTALVKIKDDLPERVTREADYFEQIINQLQSFLDTGANPPTVPPTAEQLKEPFTGTCCPPKLELLKLLSVGSKSCALPALKSEIKRVKKLLDNRALLAALARCDSLLARMSRIQTQLDKLKRGELYGWQKDGPPRSYEKFGGGDNTQALLFSMKQNQ